MRLHTVLPISLALIASLASAQDDVSFDSSGNRLLNGVYNFRQVVWIAADNTPGTLRQTISLNGTINFDGNGKYELSASVMDSTATAPQSFTRSGAYTIAASGYGYLSSTITSDGRGSVFGLVSQGVFIGSSTEDQINDLLIATPAGSPVPANDSLNGRYWVAEMNLPSNDLALARDALFQLNADGQGNLQNISASGYIGSSGRRVTQTVSGARYSFTNGIGTLALGGALTNTNLLAGDQTLFVSPDGNFIFGGSASGYNMFVGVKALAENASQDVLRGLYYLAGAHVDNADLSDSYAAYSYYGSFTAGGGNQLNHQRLLSGFTRDLYDYTYADVYDIAADASYEDLFGFRNIIGAGGNIRIGFGQDTLLGINVALRAPDLSGDGVYLNPSRLTNGASAAPFTVGISRGELISLEGTNLTAETLSDEKLPMTLGGVQVMVNGRPAPIRSVSPNRVLAVVPFATPKPIAKIQLISNGVESNTITTYVNTTSPGVFTSPAGGIGFAQAVRADSSPVSRQSPARPGETVSVYLTGLGDVDPPLPDGVAGSASPMSKAIAATEAFLDVLGDGLAGIPIPVSFAGMAPDKPGIYQVDLSLPANIASGDHYLDISTPDAYTSQVQLSVGTRGSSDTEDALRSTQIQRVTPRERRQYPRRRVLPRPASGTAEPRRILR